MLIISIHGYDEHTPKRVASSYGNTLTVLGLVHFPGTNLLTSLLSFTYVHHTSSPDMMATWSLHRTLPLLLHGPYLAVTCKTNNHNVHTCLHGPVFKYFSIKNTDYGNT